MIRQTYAVGARRSRRPQRCAFARSAFAPTAPSRMGLPTAPAVERTRECRDGRPVGRHQGCSVPGGGQSTRMPSVSRTERTPRTSSAAVPA